MRIVCSYVMYFHTPLNEVSVSAEKETSPDTKSISNMPVHNKYLNDNVCESIIFGTHHKTGTILAKALLQTMCHNVTMGKNFIPRMKPNNYVPGSPFVHFIRDPLEQVIVSTAIYILSRLFQAICKLTVISILSLQSAYQYHKVTSEKWAIESGLQDRLLNASIEDGLEIQFKQSKGVLKEMEDTYMFTTKSPSRAQDTFVIRIDNIVERDMFRLTMTTLLRWLGLSESVTVDSLEACCFISKKDRNDGTMKHVSKGSEKLKMRQIVMLKHAQEITEIRKRMDFPLVGLEQSDASTSPNSNLGQLLGERPIVILKLDRSGSTWVADKITETSPHHRVEKEVTNPFKGFEIKDICNEAVQHVHHTLLEEKGITIKPNKFGFDNKLPGTNYSCWDKISNSLKKEDPFVLVWRRQNVVAQVVSAMISHEIKNDGICPHPFHLEDCPEGRERKISVQPADFLHKCREFQQKNTKLYEYARQIGTPGSIYELTFEDLMAAGDGHGLSNRPLDLIPRQVPSTSSNEDSKLVPLPVLHQGGKPNLMTPLVNFQAVKEYLMEHAPDLVEQLMEKH